MRPIVLPTTKFEVNQDRIILDSNGQVPLIFWPVSPNFGDLLSPWLFSKMTGHSIIAVKNRVAPEVEKYRLFKKKTPNSTPNYVGIGSIISRVQDKSVVWGTGSFGTEQKMQFNRKAEYHAVRGPLTRALLKNVGICVPEIYGDPALLTPFFYNPKVEKKFEVGLVLRWSESNWLKTKVSPDIKLIDLGSPDIEGTLSDILSCKRIITSSLHGLIISDAYGIPNSWLGSDSPKGGEFKYFDYFISVGKLRKPTHYNFQSDEISLKDILNKFDFDGREIDFDPEKLLESCPFIIKSDSSDRSATRNTALTQIHTHE